MSLEKFLAKKGSKVGKVVDDVGEGLAQKVRKYAGAAGGAKREMRDHLNDAEKTVTKVGAAVAGAGAAGAGYAAGKMSDGDEDDKPKKKKRSYCED